MKNSGIMVSVVCDVYNHEPYLRQCLDGFVIQKTNFKIEVLVHDDASTDKSAEIIMEYTNKYPDIFKPILQQENQYSRGVGIWKTYQFPRVAGKYVAICEGDDYWTDPLKLQKQVDYLETHPNFSMCFHRVECLAEKGREKQDLFGYLTTKDYAEQDSNDFLKKWLVPTCSIVMRGELLHKIPHNPLFTYGDSVLVATCLSNGLIHCIGEDMGVYRLTPSGWNGSQTEMKKAKLQISHTKGMMQEFDFYRCSTMYRFLEHFYFILLIYYKENKELAKYNLTYKDYIEQFKCIKRSSFKFYFLKYKIKKLLKTILKL